MAYQTIEVRKSTPHIGAEVLCVDLSERSATSNSRRCTMPSWTT